jgi:phosphatidylglycerol:prolipoprotein diacylglycerol transferase
MKMFVLSPELAHAVHLFFEWLGIAAGVQIYRWQRRKLGLSGIMAPGQYAIVCGCVLGAAIGNKAVFWAEFPHLWSAAAPNMQLLLSGQSIVGGLLGGLLGVELAKKLTGQTASTGDRFVLPLMVGTVVGRVGCFLAGLNDGTYGVASSLPWAVDFGDGIARHPTQLYDMAFVLLYGGTLLRHAARWREKPGFLFKLYLSGYLLWRFFVDAIKPLPYDYGLGLSGIQLVCLLALAAYLPFVVLQSKTEVGLGPA